MTVQEIESILCGLYIEKNDLIAYLDKISECLLDKTQSKERIEELKKEQVHVIYEINEINYDIGIYDEMLSKLCLFKDPPQESYDSRYEVFVAGEF